MRTFLSLETQSTGQGALARGLELVGTGGPGLAPKAQLQASSRKLLGESRLQASIEALRGNR